MTEEVFLEQYCKNLNEQQLEAVRAVDGAVLLLAVPGSGKTTVLVTRLGYMVCCCGIRPENILTMTYTVSATREMGSRFARLFGSGYGQNMEIRTINGLAQKIIDYYSETENRLAFSLQDDEGLLSGLVRDIYRSYYADYPSESVIRDIRTAITYCKNSMFTQAEIDEYDIGLKHFPDIYTRYCETLRRNRQMDYDDQLLYALNILKTRPAILEDYRTRFRYLCVDESQDTSKLQHEIIRLLAGKHGNLFMVGDEDQSIYGFRAAYPDALVHFAEDYPGARVLVMEHNYRSTEPIIGAANRFVSRNRFRREKRILPTCGDGLPVQIIPTTGRTAQFQYLFALARRTEEEITILSRNNDSMVPLIDLFERNGIVYNCRQFDEVFFAHRMLRDIADIITFSAEECNADCFMRIYYKMGCIISRELAEYACAQSRRTGKAILLELIHSPDLSGSSSVPYFMLYEALKELQKDSARDALSRIRYQIGYGEYAERNKLDTGKFTILDMLARPLPSAQSLLDRLEELRVLIRDHVYAPDAKVNLSTIHSSKGLEYRSVYLLDVLDGILPSRGSQAAKKPEEIRQYEEDRRLFYVGMTRAQQKLNLFACADQKSEFVEEVVNRLPVEVFADSDLLAGVVPDGCGKSFTHAEKGSGRILAQSEEGFLVEYASGEQELLTLGELLRSRRRRMEDPRNMTTQKQKQREEPVELKENAAVEHVTYGVGTVVQMDIEMVTVRFESDGKERRFLKSAVLNTGKLKLKHK